MPLDTKIARIRALLRDAQPADDARLTSNDTLGRILRRMEPWAHRYTRWMGGFGVVLFLLKAYQVHRLAGGSFFEANAWINQHDPLLIPKIVGAAAFFAGMALLVQLVVDAERKRRAARRS